jgi:hypothetical protein
MTKTAVFSFVPALLHMTEEESLTDFTLFIDEATFGVLGRVSWHNVRREDQ